MGETTAALYCPICGQPLELPMDEKGDVVERKTCSKCKNDFLIYLTRRGTFVMTSELKE